jgi:sigma-B regulation protein RsbU (phosphoserine phosphatase)
VQHALLHTLPGRAIVVGLVARTAVYLIGLSIGAAPGFLRVVDTVAGVAVAGGAAYFLYRLLVVAKRRLLWRVRRKLILSYIFMGFIPVILIVSFFLLCGLLLFFNVSSYLVQTRLRTMEDRARYLAMNVALEIQRAGGRDVAAIVTHRQEAAAREFPDASFAVVPVKRSCAQSGGAGGSAGSVPLIVGPWSHVDAPRTIPEWIDCAGFSGLLAYSHPSGLTPAERAQSQKAVTVGGQRMELAGGTEDTHMFVRAAMFPESPGPGYAVVVDLLVGDQTRRQLRNDTGVEIKGTSAVEISDRAGASPMRGRPGGDSGPARGDSAGGPLNWVTFLDYRDWASGASGTLLVSTQPSISAMYQRISATQGQIGNRSSGQLLLYFVVLVGGLFLVIEFIALIAGLALAKSITGSVHGLFAGTERVRQGDFTRKIAVHSEDQLGELAGSFNSMTASIEDLLRQSAEKKRMEEELRIAREIQMSLLPQGPLGMPGLSVTALCVPAREVGGDYYDFFRLSDRRLGILIADVSGKGTSAALYMAELKGLMLSLSQIHMSPRDLLLAANRIIAANLDARSFITMTYAVIDLNARTMTYARAGHTPLIYVPGPESRMTPGVHVLAPDGLVLGLKIDNGEMFERLLEEETIALHEGDLAVFFTDGISEAMNEAEDFFGEGRLGRLAEEHAHLSSDELRERVLREIDAFVGTAPQHDDMTMILLKVDGLPAVATVDGGIVETAQLAEY